MARPQVGIASAAIVLNRRGLAFGYAMALAEMPFSFHGDGPFRGCADSPGALAAILGDDFPQAGTETEALARIAAALAEGDKPLASDAIPVLVRETDAPVSESAKALMTEGADAGMPALVCFHPHDVWPEAGWRCTFQPETRPLIFGLHLPLPFAHCKVAELEPPGAAHADASAAIAGFLRASLGTSILRRPARAPFLLLPLFLAVYQAAHAAGKIADLTPREIDRVLAGREMPHGIPPFAFARAFGREALEERLRTLADGRGVRSGESAHVGLPSDRRPHRRISPDQQRRFRAEFSAGFRARLLASGEPAPDMDDVLAWGIGWADPQGRDPEGSLRREAGLEAKLWGNAEASLWRMGGASAFLELHGDRCSQGAPTIAALRQALGECEAAGSPLLIGGFQRQFSVGANLGQALFEIANHEWDTLAAALESLQEAHQALKYARIPVVATTHSLCLGAGCELAMHCVGVVPEAGTVIGLPESRIGLIPAGGGLKELAARAMAAPTRPERLERLVRHYKTAASGLLARSPRAAAAAGLLDQAPIPTDRSARFALAKAALARTARTFRPRVRCGIPWGLGSEALDRLMLECESLEKTRNTRPEQRAAAERIARVMSLEGRVGADHIDEDHFLAQERDAAWRGLRTREARTGILQALGGVQG